MFDTLLIANRGEIACRVIRSARALGLRTVAVYSTADADALHVQQADAAVCIGAAPARDSYLNIAALIDACQRSGAQAVHPGYGFLSENAHFARALRSAGITFVGPSPEAIDALGHKSAAKAVAQRIGVPCLPGYAGVQQDLPHLVDEARRIGAPLMIKAAAGGGGRGMRRCTDVSDALALRELLQAARTEAEGSFGNGDLLLERLVEDARHVEVQVFGDTHGNALHLGERDCSTQRRNQKILEEAPAPGVGDELRERMGAAAVALVREVGYVGAGTVEFLLAPNGEFHFLEMNTRLQVEHPVTEAITGLDLVAWQLRVAQGEPLPLSQADIQFHGHAIEARLCAEDAFAGFAPQTGRIHHWQLPALPGVRVDHGLVAQPEISPHYDSMIAKVVAHGGSREEARQRLAAALAGSSVLGPRTNRDYLLQCLNAPAFVHGPLSTHWLTRDSAGFATPQTGSEWRAVAAALWLQRQAASHGPLSRWSSSGQRSSHILLEAAGQRHALRLHYGAAGSVQVFEGEGVVEVEVLADDGLRGSVLLAGVRQRVRLHSEGAQGWLDALGCCEAFSELSNQAPRAEDKAGSGTVSARMHGQVVRLAVAPGQTVQKGELLLAIEAMKMEHRIEATVAGTVAEVAVAVGTQVAPGRLLLRIEEKT